MKLLFPSKLYKLLALSLSLILILGLAGCSDDSPGANLMCTVTMSNLEVHKDCSTGSRVLSHLPMDLEVEILEEKTVDKITWGRIGKMTLPDGTKIKAGWINLEHVRSADDPSQDATEPTVEVQPETPPVTVNMGTVITGKLNIRKGPDSGYESVGAYVKGTRIEILERKTEGDTDWGRTNLGWIGMGYVRMDGTAPDSDQASSDTRITSDGSIAVLGYGVVDLGELNVRTGPGTEYTKVCTVKQGIRYAYYQLIDGWARIEDGWVSTDYFYIEGTGADDAITGSVTTDDLNIRTGPDTSFRTTGTYSQGDTIEILAQVDGWGYTEKGWVFMTYVDPVEPTYTTGTCKITIGLNIRKEPNADSEIVGTYLMGDLVTITEVNGSWGKTDLGWINLKFVEYN